MLNFSFLTSLAAIFSACLLHGENEWSWDFQQDPVGHAPVGFAFTTTRDAPAGKWQVVDDDGNRVLAQLDDRREKWRFALAIVEDSRLKHVELSVRIKAIDGKLDQAGGLVWRYRDAKNYLVARLDVTDRNVRLFRFVDGNAVQFGIKEDVDLKLNQWYTLRVEHEGCEIKVYLDDDVVIMNREKHFDRPGKIGLWTKADSVMYFDDLHAKRLEHDDDKDKPAKPHP